MSRVFAILYIVFSNSFILQFIETNLYLLEKFAEDVVSRQLTHISFFSVLVIFTSGLLTSLTPCMLSMLPITIGYIGGYESRGRIYSAVQSVCFALGLATTLAILGIVATGLGKVYGQVGLGLPVIVSLIAIAMGLNLLGVISFRLPHWDFFDSIDRNLPNAVRSYLFGLTFGLIASPCSTPVLATLLGWVAVSQDFILGGTFLLAYAMGYVLPLVLAGIFTASVNKIVEIRRWSGWINPVSGLMLVGFGLFSFVTRLPLNFLY